MYFQKEMEKIKILPIIFGRNFRTPELNECFALLQAGIIVK